MKRAITVRMDKIESEIQDHFTNLYCKKDFEHQYKLALTAAPDRRIFVLRRIAQMLHEVGVDCAYGKTTSYYKKLIDTLDIPATPRELQKKLIGTLCRSYAYFPKPEDFIRRVVDAIDPDSALNASLELRILRRFLQTVNVKENKKYYAKSLAVIDPEEIGESVFDVLSNTDKTKPDYDALVQGCCNLAKGRFISPATTKELLFLFAFAYGMRYYSSTAVEDYDISKDVERNLFEDYYCDNISRYLFLQDGGKAGNSDTEPSGFGLNPKNFIDAVFVYYLNRSELTPTLRVVGFYTMINRIKESWKSSHVFLGDDRLMYEAKPTTFYESRFAEALQGMDEADFEQYVLDHYYCDVRYTYTNKKTGALQEGSKGLFELRFVSNTAYARYCEVLDLVREVLNLPPHTDFSKVDKRVMKDSVSEDALLHMFSDEENVLAARISELEGNVLGLESDCFKDLADTTADFAHFSLIMRSLEKRLNPYEALGVTDALSVTRTKLIAAYYHYYCLENENGLDVGRGDIWISFKDVYEDMESCLNAYLEEAGYQRISSKNLYDVFVIFLAYCRINNCLD